MASLLGLPADSAFQWLYAATLFSKGDGTAAAVDQIFDVLLQDVFQ